MNRKEVLSNAAAATLNTTNSEILAKIAAAVPVLDIKDKVGMVNVFFMTENKKQDTKTFEFGIITQEIDSNENYSLKDLIPDDAPTTVYKEETSVADAVVKAAYNIAKQSRRGKGNNYAVFPGHVLVWYSGTNVYDNPLIRVGNNISKSPNIKEYFHLLKGVTLTVEDHKNLAGAGLNRIA